MAPVSLIRRRESKRTGRVSWQVQVPVGVDSDGRPQYLRRSFDKRKDAKEFLDDKRAERKSGGVIKPTEDTVGEYPDEWLRGATLRINALLKHGWRSQKRNEPPGGPVITR